jgi:two-component system, NtrC family, nitrogen regulation response regulator GlnG
MSLSMHAERDGTTVEASTELASPEDGRPRGPAALPALTVLGHPDLSRIGDRAFLGELARRRPALLSRQQPRFSPPGALHGRPLDDLFLSRSPWRIEPLDGGGVRICRESSRTRLAVDGAPVEDSIALTRDALEAGAVFELAGRVVLLLQTRPLPGAGSEGGPGGGFGLIGESAEIETVRAAVARVAPLDTTVLVRGASGTGKELVARALHERSPRAGGPFVGVNLAALPPSLAASELFGAKKGAYTGAVRDHAGYFQRAHGGTLFLDEVGEAPTEVQVLLLRALETGEIVPVGGQSPARVDVRVVSATDLDLESALREGAFRSPLFHRLAAYTIRLPPLRRRREDLGRLLLHFLRVELERLGGEPPPAEGREPWLPASLVTRLALYSWPGNVRQLQNVARQLVIDGRGRPSLAWTTGLDDLLPETVAAADPVAAAPAVAPERVPERTPSRPEGWRRPSEIGEEEMLAALRAHRWNLKAAAGALGIARTSLYSLLERSPRVRSAADLPPEEVHRAWERYGGHVEALAAALEVSERALRQRLKDLGLR